TPATVVEWQMRAWWSVLLLPQKLTNLRIRYACSLLCLEEPTQNTESGPLALRRSCSFAVTSFKAWSHEMRSYLPFTSFMGYRRRNSPWPCSPSAAPFAQCAPRLIGESNTGSWRTHTPFSTTASTAQPTEQCVHTVRFTSMRPSPIAGPLSLAWAFFTSVSWEAAMPTPTPSPERRRKARRSIVGRADESPRCRLCTNGERAVAWVEPVFFVSNMEVSGDQTSVVL